MRLSLPVLMLCGLISLAQARDDGRYAQSPLKNWFNSLKNQTGVPCCDTADGRRIDDADVEMKPDGYYVRVDGVWYPVPPDAVINVPNRAGVPIVWPFVDQKGKMQIRCFIPGAGI